MPKVMSLEELNVLRDRYRSQVDLRERGEKIDEMIVLTVGMGTSGIEAGAREVMATLAHKVDEMGFDNVVVIHSDTVGSAEEAPVVVRTTPGKEPVVYQKVTVEKVSEIVEGIVTL